MPFQYLSHSATVLRSVLDRESGAPEVAAMVLQVASYLRVIHHMV
jgi:hypothetical protein